MITEIPVCSHKTTPALIRIGTLSKLIQLNTHNDY